MKRTQNPNWHTELGIAFVAEVTAPPVHLFERRAASGASAGVFQRLDVL